MFGVLPILLARHGVIAVGRLRQVAIMVVFMPPLAWIVRRVLLACWGTSHIGGEVGPRTIATVGVRLGYHFEHFKSPRARSKFDHMTAAEGCGPFGQKPNVFHWARQELNVWLFLYGRSVV